CGRISDDASPAKTHLLRVDEHGGLLFGSHFVLDDSYQIQGANIARVAAVDERHRAPIHGSPVRVDVSWRGRNVLPPIHRRSPCPFYPDRGCSVRALSSRRSRRSVEATPVRLRLLGCTGAPGVCSFLHPVAVREPRARCRPWSVGLRGAMVWSFCLIVPMGY